MSKWKLLRVCLIALSAIASFFTPLEPQANPPIEWNALGIIFMFIPICLLIVVGIQVVNPLSAKIWHKPDWNLNPLNFKDPIQFFHFGGYLMLIQGVITLCRLLLSKVSIYPEAIIPLVMGLGILLGVQIIMLAFKSKFNSL